MDYTQITSDEQASMLGAIGVKDIGDLFEVIPEEIRFTDTLDLPPAMSELELQRALVEMAADNHGPHDMVCFMGAGAYDHFYPVLIDQLISRGEYLTAYTPYQAEASQGSLQAFFEFQTQMARLTGLDIANASVYDGASAVAEAAAMSLGASGKKRVLVASTLHTHYRRVLDTYLADQPAECVELDQIDGRISPETVRENLDEDTACVVIQSPNVWGLIEDWEGCFTAAHEQPKTCAVAVFNPIACGLLKKPGECGADIAIGEGQPLGIPMSLGGPHLGLFAARQQFIRKMPGRLIGRTVDAEGRPAYCLTLQTREQHIKGAKATSNICTNQGLMAMRATMFLTALGQAGMRELAELCYHKAHYLAGRIAELDGYSLKHDGPFFHEFAVQCPKPAGEIIAACKARGILPGVDCSSPRIGAIGEPNELLIAVTEKRTRHELDAFVEVLGEVSA
ncbi:MAG: aminomethyl-transferring glycine dehydrogenase subunit GcvPA [Phycisphaerales bacterium]|nr:MAG: aminomethyl-transferring glycine dehydrogenase subunit GcvPA [Phycisphaerales bacterium]